MANFFRNVISNNIGTTPAVVLDVPGNARVTVIGMSLTNLTLGAILVSVEVELLTAPVSRGYYCKDVLVPANTSLRLVNGGEKLILTQSNKLYVSSNANNSVDALVSYVEIV